MLRRSGRLDRVEGAQTSRKLAQATCSGSSQDTSPASFPGLLKCIVIPAMLLGRGNDATDLAPRSLEHGSLFRQEFHFPV